MLNKIIVSGSRSCLKSGIHFFASAYVCLVYFSVYTIAIKCILSTVYIPLLNIQYNSKVAVINIPEDFENASPYFCTFLANRICV